MLISKRRQVLLVVPAHLREATLSMLVSYIITEGVKENKLSSQEICNTEEKYVSSISKTKTFQNPVRNKFFF